MTSMLYYAGMAADRQTEQIGLAVAKDGGPFERVRQSGLIMARDEAIAWKSIRVCNPTVIRFGGDWLMFYQGVGKGVGGGVTHTIGLARSGDGISWESDERPLLTFDDFRGRVNNLPAGDTGGVIEPAILVVAHSLVMYFVAYLGTYRNGTYLCRATSENGRQWRIDPDWVLSSTQFGDYRLHYPEAVADGELLHMWFTLMERKGSTAAILCMESCDGRHFDRLKQMLPAAESAPHVGPRERIAVRLNGRRLPGLSRLNQLLHRILSDPTPYLGCAHSHVDSRNRRLFYHAYHLNRQGLVWMDIRSVGLDDSTTEVTALAPAPAGAWDSFFVADPFVVTV